MADILQVEQLSDAGEETLILSANVTDGQVDQLGSESGKLFVDVYDDFKSEFLGFCQRSKYRDWQLVRVGGNIEQKMITLLLVSWEIVFLWELEFCKINKWWISEQNLK